MSRCTNEVKWGLAKMKINYLLKPEQVDARLRITALFTLNKIVKKIHKEGNLFALDGWKIGNTEG